MPSCRRTTFRIRISAVGHSVTRSRAARLAFRYEENRPSESQASECSRRCSSRKAILRQDGSYMLLNENPNGLFPVPLPTAIARPS